MNTPPRFGIGSVEWAGLAKLTEECGELLQVLGKLVQTGGDINHWDGDLRPRLIEEIGDVRAALDFFEVMNFETTGLDLIEARHETKLALFHAWAVEQTVALEPRRSAPKVVR